MCIRDSFRRHQGILRSPAAASARSSGRCLGQAKATDAGGQSHQRDQRANLPVHGHSPPTLWSLPQWQGRRTNPNISPVYREAVAPVLLPAAALCRTRRAPRRVRAQPARVSAPHHGAGSTRSAAPPRLTGSLLPLPLRRHGLPHQPGVWHTNYFAGQSH